MNSNLRLKKIILLKNVLSKIRSFTLLIKSLIVIETNIKKYPKKKLHFFKRPKLMFDKVICLEEQQENLKF